MVKFGAFVRQRHAILERSTATARVIFRSAHAEPGYLRGVHVTAGGRPGPLLERLQFHPELAVQLTQQDRVHTYAGFHIADIRR